MTLQSIGSMIPQTGGSRPGGAGILQTQLSRYETQLADWCNCPSGKTPEGKKIITDLQKKADAIKMQIKQIEDVRVRGGDSTPPVPGASRSSQGNFSSASGSRLDVYA